MTQHTQGPWILKEPDEYGTVCINTPDGYPLAIVSQYGGEHKKQSDANAHLIAVAPLMYETLKELREYFDGRSDADCDQDGYIPNQEMTILASIDQLLNKAKGL